MKHRAWGLKWTKTLYWIIWNRFQDNSLYMYGHFHNQWYTFEIHIILTYKINIEVLDSNLPTWSNTSQVMLPWVA